MALDIDIAIIGAGPYGLSLAAHLNKHQVSAEVFGKQMGFWRDHMPKGMHLKSDGFASNYYDPDNFYTLKQYCSEQGLPYDDKSIPVALEVFIDYGRAFEKRFVPNVQQNDVVAPRQNLGHFELRLDSGHHNGKTGCHRRGGAKLSKSTAWFEGLGSQFVTHSSDHHDFTSFSNREVVVLGAGSSAVDSAALLKDAGARVQLVARKPVVIIHSGGPAQKRSLWQRVRHPSSGIGPGLRNRIYCEVPWLFQKLPEKLRLSIVRRSLGPASGWFMRERVIGQSRVLS